MDWPSTQNVVQLSPEYAESRRKIGEIVEDCGKGHMHDIFDSLSVSQRRKLFMEVFPGNYKDVWRYLYGN